MYLTQVNMIRGLTKAEYFQLRKMCFFSNCPLCKDNDNYKLLQSNMAQQTLRAADFAFKSFFGSVGKVKSARPPRYRKKGGLYNLIITGNSISIQDGYLTVPQSRTISYEKVSRDSTESDCVWGFWTAL